MATAAYGTAWEPNVVKLRSFRDQLLMASPVGRGFVSLYHVAGPPLAAFVAVRPWARAATRVALTPAATIAGALTGDATDIGLVAVAVAGVLGLRRRRRAARRRSGGSAGPDVRGLPPQP